MKQTNYLSIVFIFLLIVNPLKAQIPEGQLIEDTIPAPSLTNNMFNDITEQPIAVYLPPSYDTSYINYPVVYFLTGFSTPINYFTTNGVFQGFKLKESMDNLIYEGVINEMIVVIPNGLTFMLGGFYVNSPVRGNWEDYLIEDLIGYIDNNFSTIPNSASRGITGHSMGGFGALNLAMLHPEIFCATYGLSPGLFDTIGLSNTEMFANQNNIIQYLEKEEELNAMSPEVAHTAFVAFIDSLILANNNSLVFTYAYGSAFSPNPENNAPYIDYPYYMSGNDLILDTLIWQNWENGFGGLDEEVVIYKDNLLELEAITIDYGIYDYYSWIPDGCEYFSQLLTNEGIPHELSAFNGGHSNKVRERIEEYILPYFSNILEFDTLTFRKTPYLLYTGDNTTMKIIWQMEDTATCFLQWGLDTTYSTGSINTTEYGNDHLHTHTISGLTPGTKYYYRVICEDVHYTGSFNTAPEENDTDIKFMIVGDTRTHYWTHDSVAHAMVSTYTEEPDYQTLIIAIGDLVEFGAEETSWQNEFFNDSLNYVRRRMAEVPFNTSLGNHEIFYLNYTNYNLNVPVFKKYFPYPFVDRTYWSFDYGTIHFTIVDQYPANYSPYGQGLISSEQLTWIENDLSSTDKPWKIIVLHEPGWSAGGSSSGSPHYNNDDVQNLLQPLCEEYGVQMLICGHNHYYARAYKNGICHLTSAGGCAPIYEPEPEYPNVVLTRQENHFCKVDVNDTVLSVLVVNPINEVIDEFDFYQNKRPGHLLGFVSIDTVVNVQDVLIEVNGVETHPDEIGYYGLELEEGFYDVTVSMEGYEPQIFENIEIQEGTETILNIDLLTSVKPQIKDIDVEFQITPNPISEIVNIKYNLPAKGIVSLTIYDFTGQIIAELLHQEQSKGEHQFKWNTSRLPDGIYLYTLKINREKIIRKLIKF